MSHMFCRKQGSAQWDSKGSKLNLIEITYENEANKEKEREKKSDVNKEVG